MAEEATMTKPVSEVAPVKAVAPDVKEVDITKMTLEEKLAPIANPSSIKDFFVNNLYASADKVYKEYKGTEGQQSELARLLQSQALYCKTNNGFAFFGDNANQSFEKGLQTKGVEAARYVYDNSRAKLLPEVHNFPTDPKIAAEFTAIVNAAFHQAVDSRAVQLGLNKPAEVTATEVTSAKEEKIAVSVGQ